MIYHTVYDAGANGYSLTAPLFGLVFAVFMGLMFFKPQALGIERIKGMEGPKRTVFLSIFFCGTALWISLTIWASIHTHNAVARELREGRVKVVAGPVVDFVPMPPMGHALESFSVKGHQFAYADQLESPGFHQTSSHGGPMREGLYVRISYITLSNLGNTILKIEVAQNQDQSSPQ